MTKYERLGFVREPRVLTQEKPDVLGPAGAGDELGFQTVLWNRGCKLGVESLAMSLLPSCPCLRSLAVLGIRRVLFYLP